MTAKKARADKGVLSRQEIATRRKALQEKKMQTGGAGKRALVGVFLLAGSLLTLLSVATYDPRDRVGPGFHNSVGPVGHLLASGLRGLLGLVAYLVPLCGLYASGVLFVGNRERRRWPQVLSLGLLALSAAVLAHITLADQPGWSHPPGGAIGAGLAGLLEGLFSTVGTVILVTAVCIAALIVGTQYTFLRLCSLAWEAAGVLARRAGVAFAAFLEQQKEAHRERQERAAAAREEEAAFLAQLEADEEELLEAEREAMEAEAMAEEAVRLAKATEDKKALERGEKEKKPAKEPRQLAAGAAAVAASNVVSLPAPASLAERRPSPGADPAWASALAPVQAAALPAAEAEAPRKRERKAPAIVTAPAAPAAASIPAATLAAASAAVAPAVAQLAAEPAVAVASTALAPVAPLPPPPAAAALARMPVIVEPKAPPKPTKKAEDFEFVGDRKSFTLPPLDVLECDKQERGELDKDAFLVTAEKLRAKLADFGIVGEVVEIRPGPVVTMYEFLPGPGIKVSKIAALQDDLAMAMEAMRVRIVAPIPGKGVVGIEVPNRDRETVFLKEVAEQDAFRQSASRLTMCVGKDIEGMPYVLDLAKAPHLLIAGTTGSGKSVAVNSMIMSILLKSTPEEVRFIMVDPKMLELSVYEGIPHLLLPVVTDAKKAALALRWAVEEMERRYHLLSEAGVRNIAGYNKFVESSATVVKPVEGKKAQKPKKSALIIDVAEGETEDEALARQATEGVSAPGVAAPRDEPEDVREALTGAPAEAPDAGDTNDDALDAAIDAAADGDASAAERSASEKKELKKLPYIVVIIDELADLMMVASREVETYVARLAQMARAAGIHLMVATQRPSTDVVTGIIKANFPTRVSFMLRSKPDSMTILGTVGAEALLGMGDMLIMPPTSAHLQRVHGAYVSEGEIKKVVDHLKAQGKPVFDESILKPRDEDVEAGGEEDELSDELYDQALATVSEMRAVSISMLQRKMRIGYNRAARMIERMERDGVVGPADGAKPREVLIRQVGEMPGAGAM
ncbi:DNA translocase FtsK [Aggregicoccus sp. 17bor-14]|uniref:FtsK/SpoIIIE family DNA translocase n=1 Tax=Myxococcaceae TaxID=31 RepID=UPI00129C53CB|nr:MULTISPECIES: DNA translocase FtsK 4TM domain-containing protein [Myxococcaceae]MBF5043729.1 DNA translocase FtsK 4TM domain-containing protein [Simulacricoccus sp. 17bor-14]MRI89485.1 DNA translocase FtsK [Aggregicoccus sp. 17bor-14]